MLHLKAWHHPLPDWLEEAVRSGKLVVKQGKHKYGDYEYLEGEVMSPYGYFVKF